MSGVERSRTILKWMSPIAFVLAAVGISAGCQPTLTQEARAGINSVRIDTDISLPERMDWGNDSGAGGPLWFAAITVGAEIASIPRKLSQSRVIRLLMDENNIAPGRMIATQFKEQLETRQVFPSIVETDGDATFTFEILSYGLMWDSSRVPWPPYPLKPVLKVVVCLKKPDGTLIWRNRAETFDSTGEVDGYVYNEYIQNPSLLRRGFEQAASKIVSQFMKNIRAHEP